MTTNPASSQPETIAHTDSPDQADTDARREIRRRLLVIAAVFVVVLLSLDLRVRTVRDTVVDTPLRADAGQYLLYAQGISLLCVYFTALHMVGAPIPRYTVPLRPMLYAMAGLGLVLLYRYLAALYRARGAMGGDRARSPDNGQGQAFEPSSPLNR